jgi:hypothetical protein
VEPFFKIQKIIIVVNKIIKKLDIYFLTFPSPFVIQLEVVTCGFALRDEILDSGLVWMLEMYEIEEFGGRGSPYRPSGECTDLSIIT